MAVGATFRCIRLAGRIYLSSGNGCLYFTVFLVGNSLIILNIHSVLIHAKHQSLAPAEALQRMFVLEHLKSTLMAMQNTWKFLRVCVDCYNLCMLKWCSVHMNTPVKY